MDRKRKKFHIDFNCHSEQQLKNHDELLLLLRLSDSFFFGSFLFQFLRFFPFFLFSFPLLFSYSFFLFFFF